ncbi:hypothetical protein IAT38_004138 [Cryptococcus sp. DSM 104549]
MVFTPPRFQSQPRAPYVPPPRFQSPPRYFPVAPPRYQAPPQYQAPPSPTLSASSITSDDSWYDAIAPRVPPKEADCEVMIVSSDRLVFHASRSQVISNSTWFAQNLRPSPAAGSRPLYGSNRLALFGGYRDRATSVALFLASLNSTLDSIIPHDSLMQDLDVLRDGIEFAKHHGCPKMQAELEERLARAVKLWGSVLKLTALESSEVDAHSTKLGCSPTKVILEPESEHVSLVYRLQEPTTQRQPAASFGADIWGYGKWEDRATKFGWSSPDSPKSSPSLVSSGSNDNVSPEEESSEDEMVGWGGSRCASPVTSEGSWCFC